ncbi:hypothetical protein N7513_006881 [Penicillium frequentans]|nr:hypothetical protein N7513_006881 [Penicillium glabrum]
MRLVQTKPGQYERPFDTLETFHRTIAAIGDCFQDGSEHYFVVSPVRIRNKPDVNDLKQAWKALRHLHPRIAMSVDETGTSCRYTVPTSDALDQWLNETFIVHPEEEIDVISREKLHLRLPVSPFFKLHWLPASQELLFRSPHWYVDGLGMMMIQDAYLSILSSPAQHVVFDGSEISRIPPTMDDLIAPDFEITEEAKKALEAELQVALSGPEVAVLIEALPSVEPRHTLRASRKFSKEETAQITTAFKQRGLKFAGAVQSALLLVAARHSAPANGRLLYMSIFNIRKYLATPWNGTAGASGIYHTARLHSFNMENGKDYHSISQIQSSFYAESIERTFGFMPLHIQNYTSMIDVPADVANVGSFTARAGMSSLGVVDDHLQNRYEGSRYTIEIDDWWIGTQCLNKELQGHVWTRDGQLHMAIHYNEAFWKNDDVEQFIDEWKSILATEFIH